MLYQGIDLPIPLLNENSGELFLTDITLVPFLIILLGAEAMEDLVILLPGDIDLQFRFLEGPLPQILAEWQG